MVYGKNLLENAKRLADLVDNIEIIRYKTMNVNTTLDRKDL